MLTSRVGTAAGRCTVAAAAARAHCTAQRRIAAAARSSAALTSDNPAVQPCAARTSICSGIASPTSSCPAARFSSSAGALAAAASSGTAASAAVPAASSLPPLPLFQHLTSADFLQRPALLTGGDDAAEASYAELLSNARVVQAKLQRAVGRSDLRDVRVGLLYSGGVSFVSSLFGVWLSGGIAIPLHTAHPAPELNYLLEDAGVAVLLVGKELRSLADSLTAPPAQEGEKPMQLLEWDAASAAADSVSSSSSSSSSSSQSIDSQSQQPLPYSFGPPSDFLLRRALFIYTSGTTGRPKGVVWTHKMLEFQLSTLTKLWGWRKEDRILCVLPLHHIHGLVNVVLCAFYSGARVTFPPSSVKFSTPQIAQALMDSSERRKLSVFMAVPTIYSQLLTWLRSQPSALQSLFRERVKSNFRLMVSGSSALPEPILSGWESATGGVLLLERYGMSETGMTLSQPLDEAKRRTMMGTVGSPLPGVQVKIVPMEAAAEDASPAAIAAAAAMSAAAATESSSASNSNGPPSPSSLAPTTERIGSLLVRGPGVFSEYWRRPEKTAEEFDHGDGWFKTGDVVSVTKGEDGSDSVYRLLGRASVDVLKSGGYKISALDVERELLAHPEIENVAVLGLPDAEFGQRVAAVVQLRAGSGCSSSDSLQHWCRSRMASYQVPRAWRIVSVLPRNAMGKTNKKELAKLFEKQAGK